MTLCRKVISVVNIALSLDSLLQAQQLNKPKQASQVLALFINTTKQL